MLPYAVPDMVRVTKYDSDFRAIGNDAVVQMIKKSFSRQQLELGSGAC